MNSLRLTLRLSGSLGLAAVALALISPTALSAPWGSNASHTNATLQDPDDDEEEEGDDPIESDDAKREELIKSIKQAARVGDSDLVSRLMRRNQVYAEEIVVEAAKKLGAQPDKETSELIKVLRIGWKKAYGNSGFVDKMERYHGLISPATRESRDKIEVAYWPALNEYLRRNAEEPSDQRNLILASLGEQLEEFGGAFVEVGDQYFAGSAYYAAAYCSDAPLVGDKHANLARVARCYQKVIETREAIELDDRLVLDARNRLEVLEGFGYKPGLSAEEAAKVTPGIEFGETSVVSGTYEVVEDLFSLEQPNYTLDLAFVTWPSLYLTENGTTAKFVNAENSPVVKRVGAAELEVTGTDGAAVTVSVTGNPVLIETTIGKDPMPWAFVARLPGTEVFQGIESNMEATIDGMSVYVAPASGMTFNVGETPVTVFDANMDGWYGGLPVTIGYRDLPDGRFQPEIDVMRVGKEKRLRPFSEFVDVDGQWYQFSMEDERNGRVMNLTPVTIKAGELSLANKGAKLDFCVVRGSGKLENSFFDLAAAKKTAVPIGAYSLYVGGTREGKRYDSIIKSLVLPGEQMEPLGTSVEEPGKLTLGAPYRLEFQAEAGAGSVTVPGRTVRVAGVGGEHYHRLWNARIQPEVSVRKAGGSKGSKPVKMELVNDPNTLSDKGFPQAWYPLSLTVEHKFKDAPVEVQLTMKKSKLFGKLESEWLPLE